RGDLRERGVVGRGLAFGGQASGVVVGEVGGVAVRVGARQRVAVGVVGGAGGAQQGVARVVLGLGGGLSGLVVGGGGVRAVGQRGLDRAPGVVVGRARALVHPVDDAGGFAGCVVSVLGALGAAGAGGLRQEPGGVGVVVAGGARRLRSDVVVLAAAGGQLGAAGAAQAQHLGAGECAPEVVVGRGLDRAGGVGDLQRVAVQVVGCGRGAVQAAGVLRRGGQVPELV